MRFVRRWLRLKISKLKFMLLITGSQKSKMDAFMLDKFVYNLLIEFNAEYPIKVEELNLEVNILKSWISTAKINLQHYQYILFYRLLHDNFVKF